MAELADQQIIRLGMIRHGGDQPINAITEQGCPAALLVGGAMVFPKMAEKLSALHALKV